VIVKIHSRGTGGGGGPVNYLLGKKRDRDGATLLRGDPDITAELIDGLQFSQRYTSGVLSFAEADLPESKKAEIMDSFERVLMPGLDADQRSVFWVEHRDKGRLELNFVVPNVELISGKRLAPYYDRADRQRINAWQTIVNGVEGLADPHDPARRRTLATPRDLPADRQKAAEAITGGLLALAEQGVVRDRKSVVEALEGAGFTVARQTATSISIADPDGGKNIGKNIRLKGAIYERSFDLGKGLRAEIEAASERYHREREDRVREARERLAESIERKRKYNGERYPRQASELTSARDQGVVVARAELTADLFFKPRSSVVDGAESREEPRTARGAESASACARLEHPAWERGGRAVHDAPERRGAAKCVPVQSVELQGSLGDQDANEVTIDDRTREAAFERVRAVVEAVRAVAERVREGYQRLVGAGAELVGAGAELEHACTRLVGAGAELEHAGEQLIQRHDAAQRRTSASCDYENSL